MKQVFANNFSTTVASTFGISDIYLNLTSVTGLPTLGVDEFISLTLYRQVGVEESGHEVVHVTNVTGLQCTVSRSEEGADASQFLAGDRVQARITKAAIELKADQATTYTKTESDAALALKANQATTYTKTETDAAIAAVVDAAPGTLDTLNELAAALGDDANFAASTAAALGTKEVAANKDASGGYAGLTLFKLNLRNAANTFTNFLTNATTAVRTWTMPDKDGTVAMTSDITGTNSGTNTGDQTSIVGITGTIAQFNTAVTDADLAVLGTNNFADATQSRMVLKDTAYTAVAKGNSGTSTVTFDYEAGSHQSSVATGNHTFALSNLPPAGSNAYLHVEFWGYGSYTITPPTVSWKLPAGGVTSSLSTYFTAVAAAGGPSGFATTGNVTEFVFWESVDKSVVFGKLL